MIDPSRLAPRAGSYAGVEPMGLIDSMSSPPSATSGFVYFWKRTSSDFRFTVSVGGRVVASTTVQRYVIPPEPKLVERDFTMENDGFVGRYTAPRPGRHHSRRCCCSADPKAAWAARCSPSRSRRRATRPWTSRTSTRRAFRQRCRTSGSSTSPGRCGGSRPSRASIRADCG